MNKQQLRRALKRVRLDIPRSQARTAQAEALHLLTRERWLRRATRVAGYFGSGGEIDPTPLMNDLQRSGKSVFVPVLSPLNPGHLWFCRWRNGDRLVTNRYGIPEPDALRGRLCAVKQLDLVIVPLLGFDDNCRRLGMGGGYYDRSFAFRNVLHRVTRPRLVGLAYDEQRVPALHTCPWDVQLDAIVTPSATYRRPLTA